MQELAQSYFTEWLEKAKHRAAMMESISPLARAHELQPLSPAAPAWLEANTRPIEVEQPCGFVRSMIARQRQPQKLFRSFHGKEKRVA